MNDHKDIILNAFGRMYFIILRIVERLDAFLNNIIVIDDNRAKFEHDFFHSRIVLTFCDFFRTKANNNKNSYLNFTTFYSDSNQNNVERRLQFIQMLRKRLTRAKVNALICSFTIFKRFVAFCTYLIK